MSYSNKDASLSTLLPAPTIKDREHRKPLLCGPGPADLWPSIHDALNEPILSPMDDEYFHQVDDIRKGLQYAFQTTTNLVLAISGSGHTGMETIISNLVAPGQTLLVAARGIWDERATSMAKRYGCKVVVHRVAPNCTHNLKDLEMTVKRVRPAAVFITHGDSSTGTVQNMLGLGDMCHKYGSLLLVDTVVSLVAVPFLMDEWNVDAVYSSTQKAFSGPTGIAPVAFSARAEAVINNRKHEPPFYFDVKLLAQQWNCYGNTRVYHHTLSSPMISALRCCLKEIINESLPVSWARHAQTASHFQERLQQLRLSTGLDFWAPKAEDRLVTVTTVTLPAGYDYMEVVKYIKAKHNIQIFGGLGITAGKVLRIGLMGVNSTIEVADRVADAMTDALMALKKSKL